MPKQPNERLQTERIVSLAIELVQEVPQHLDLILSQVDVQEHLYYCLDLFEPDLFILALEMVEDVLLAAAASSLFELGVQRDEDISGQDEDLCLERLLHMGECVLYVRDEQVAFAFPITDLEQHIDLWSVRGLRSMLDAVCEFVDLQPAVVVAVVDVKHLLERHLGSSRLYGLLHRAEHLSGSDAL